MNVDLVFIALVGVMEDFKEGGPRWSLTRYSSGSSLRARRV